jgi:hypothetical protein
MCSVERGIPSIRPAFFWVCEVRLKPLEEAILEARSIDLHTVSVYEVGCIRIDTAAADAPVADTERRRVRVCSETRVQKQMQRSGRTASPAPKISSRTKIGSNTSEECRLSATILQIKRYIPFVE